MYFMNKLVEQIAILQVTAFGIKETRFSVLVSQFLTGFEKNDNEKKCWHFALPGFNALWHFICDTLF